MKKSSKRIIMGVVGTALIASMASGCGKKSDSTSLSYWIELPGAASAVVSNLGETPLAKKLQEKTGITVDYQHPPQGQGAEKFNIMMASKNLPDIVAYNWTKYPGGPEKASKEGKIIKVNEYIDKYAPRLKEHFANNKEDDRLAKTDSGDYFSFPFIRGDVSLGINQAMFVRKDWLEELGMQPPETIDEWEAYLTALKNKGVEYPMDINPYPLANGVFTGAYGTTWDFYVEDGKVKYGPYEENFKQAVLKLNDWYNKKLINPDFAALDDAAKNSDLINGKTGAVFGSCGGSLGNWLKAKTDDKFDLVGVKYPVLNKGDVPKFNSAQLTVQTSFNAITTSCKNPDVAAQYLAYGYSEEGEMLYNFGIEGESYEMVGDYPTYTDNITNNSEGFAMSNMLAQYTLSYWAGPFIQDKRYYEQYAGLPQQQQAWETASEFDGVVRRVPYLYYSAEESSELVKKQTALVDHVQEEVCKFIVGLRPMEEYDKYIEELKELKVEEILKSQQAAYDRYLQR